MTVWRDIPFASGKRIFSILGTDRVMMTLASVALVSSASS